MTRQPLLSIRGLSVSYPLRASGTRQVLRVIEGLDLDVATGETLAVVGESGSGKTTLAETLVGLVRPTEGSIVFDGQDLTGRPGNRRGSLRGSARREVRRRIQLVAQNPRLALSPRRAVKSQIEEPLIVHTRLPAAERRARVATMLAGLELSSAIGPRLPHELSGGQAQRVVLARALILEPSLILFDEPTSALDASVQAGVLNLLRRLKADLGLTYLFITHDLGVARHLADRIAVMRLGEIIEQRPTAELFEEPDHTYTRELLASSLSV